MLAMHPVGAVGHVRDEAHVVWAGGRLIVFPGGPDNIRCVAPNRHGLPCGRRVGGGPTSFGPNHEDRSDETMRWVMQRCWFHSPSALRSLADAPLAAAPVAWTAVPATGVHGSAVADAIYFVANDPATGSDTIASLSGDPDAALRAAVARHPRCPADVLASLVSDPDPLVRRAVCENPSADESVRSYAVLAE